MELAPSIDNFLHTHSAIPGLTDVGKYLIADAIGKAERKSPLFVSFDNQNRDTLPKGIDRTWLGALFKSLATGRDYQSFLDGLNRIHFVTFNYDRCIERFFGLAVPSYFNVRPESRFWQSLHITHVFGITAAYDFEHTIRGKIDEYIQEEWHQAMMLEAPKTIRTFTEGVDSSVGVSIKQALQDSSLLLFLGFGFHPLNMKFFNMAQGNKKVRVLGSTLGLSEPNVDEVWGDISQAIKCSGNPRGSSLDRVSLYAATASQLIYDHARSIEKALGIHR